MYYILIYLIVVNIAAVVITVSDKRRAIRHRWRIPERTLLIVSAIGGSPAMLITMLLIHHKTNHLKFMLGIPIIIVLQLALLFVMKGVFHVF